VTVPAEAAAVTGAAGVRCLPVPTPFAVGPVNAYLLDGPPLTLVDTGPNSATSMLALERMLAASDHRVEDLELLVVTHQHVDHLGLTGMVAERSGAEVACLDIAAGLVENFEDHSTANDDYAAALMLRHGIDGDVVDALRAMTRILQSFGASARVTRPLIAGDELAVGARRLRVLHRPGHSPSDTVLHDEDAGMLIAGDHLLSRVSSNALVTRPLSPDWDGSRPRPLMDYRASLEATRDLDADLVLGGHGPPVSRPRALIGHRLERQNRRAGELHELLRRGPMSAHELATAMFGRVAFTQAFLTLSEVLGHLDLLIADGVVAETSDGGLTRFERR
jgi:glyoxylase-like metal-dependent hydrolase (beta-lactamase superfamily II)